MRQLEPAASRRIEQPYTHLVAHAPTDAAFA
jgi:hypothetical protein